MPTEERKPTSSGQQKSGKSNTWQQRQGNEGNKKETSGIPILRFGKGNNFYQFKQTLSEVSLREFGNLGKLIQRGTYFQPEYVPPSSSDNLTSTMQNALTLEALKEHQKFLDKMKNDRPKLFGLIMQHLSAESKDEIRDSPDFEEWYAETDPEKRWQAIERTHKVDCLSNVNEVIELSARKAYHSQRQGALETLVQYSDRFRETYRSYKENCPNLNISDKEQAMDFFHGLDNNCYESFKASMMNGWASKAIDTPDTVNLIY
jgi:hypothetical protein